MNARFLERACFLQDFGDGDGAGFVAGLAGVGVVGGEGEAVDVAFVHGEVDFS